MRRSRWWVCMGLGWGLIGQGADLEAQPAILTVDQIKPGMKGIGKTVFHGTEIEEFDVTVLGVLEKFDFGSDLILIRIDSGPVVDQGWGLCAGMSGSPVYINGKLIGAIALSLANFSKAPLAGVTPIAEMLASFAHRQREPLPPTGNPSRASSRAAGGLPESTHKLRLRDRPLQLEGQTFQQALVFATAQQVETPPPGTLAFVPMAAPLMVNGLGPRGKRYLEKVLEPFPLRPQVAMGLGPAPPDAEFHLEPGAAVGVQLCRGAIDATAIGTLTYIDGHTVLAFGHPMFELGAVDLPLTGAYIHAIWPSQDLSLKVGSSLAPIGSILEDRFPGIGGFLGRTSATLPADFTVKDVDRNLSRDYHLEVLQHKRLTSYLLSSLMAGAVDVTTSPLREGVTHLHLEVQPKGYPAITRDNLFSSGGGMSAFSLLFGGSGPDSELANILGTLSDNPFGEVRVESVKAEIEVREEHRTADLARVYPEKTTVKPGETIDLAVYLKPYEQPEEVIHVPLHIPKNAPAGRALVAVVGGESEGALKPRLGRRDPIPINLDQLLANLRKSDRNDELVVLLHLATTGLEIEGVQLSDVPLPIGEVLRSARARNILPLREVQEEKHPQSRVLSGAALVPLKIQADERDKISPVPVRGESGGQDEEMSPGTQVVLEIPPQGDDPIPAFLAAFERLESHLMPLAEGNGLALKTDAQDGKDSADPASKDPASSEEKKKESQPGGKEEAPPAEIPDLTAELALEEGPAMPTWEEVQAIEKETGPAVESQEKAAQKSRALARPPQVWEWRKAADFDQGEFKGTCLNGEGRLILAPDFQPLSGPPCGLSWKQVVDAQGHWYVGSWAPGTIYRRTPEGTWEPYFQSEELALHALTLGPDGVLYAGALPSGKIYKITAANQATVLATLPEKYIWELVCLANGDLYAATGNEGKLYRITPDGTVKALFQARDRHLLALTPGPEQTLYVGTYPNGKIYHVKPEVDPALVSAVYEVPDAAVLSLASSPNGCLYVGTTPKGTLYKIAPDGSVQQLGPQEGESSPQAKARHIFRLVPGAEGTIYAAAGSAGRIYRIDADDTLSTVYDPEEEFVLDLTPGEGQSLYATYSGTAQRARLNLGRTWRGEYLSEVKDAGFLSRWGQLRWNADLPPGTQVTVQTRSGNTRYPDESWSNWSEEYAASAGTPVTSPPARYLQCRAILYGSAEGARPVLRWMQLFHLTKNRAPRLTEVSVGKQTIVSGKVNVRWTARDPDNDTLTYESFFSSDGKTWQPLEQKKEEKEKDTGGPGPAGEGSGEGPGVEKTPENAEQGTEGEEATSSEEAPRVDATGAAATQELPDETEGGSEAEASESEEATEETPEESLTGTEEERNPEQEESKPEEETGASKKTNLEWDTTKIPDGQYWIRVTVTDRTSNPQEAETDEKLSEPFIVDNQPPVILLSPGPEAMVPPQTVRVSDATTYIASAEFKVDKGEWTGAGCADRIFDSPYEDVVLDLSTVPPGEHTLQLRVRDAAGNEATCEVKINLPKSGNNG